jgi:Zn ribbon nucleic-acid-binding protein
MSKKKTLTEFIEKANLIHQNKFSYEKVVYINSHSKIEITCPEHGGFIQKPYSHINGQECNKCKGGVKYTAEEFIEKSKSNNGTKFSYLNINYVNSRTPIEIYCNKHKKYFKVTPHSHLLNNSGCDICTTEKLYKNNTQRKTPEQFLIDLKKVHGNKYNYEKVNYRLSRKKIVVTCLKHGDFETNANNFIMGANCPVCSLENREDPRTITQEQFIKIARGVHSNKYSYDMTKYKKSHTKVIVTCKIHGDFNTTPVSFLKGTGCAKCGVDAAKLKQTTPLEKVIEKIKLTHKNRYTYNFDDYKNSRSKIKIICKKHGEFIQQIHEHIAGSGCPRCYESKGEMKVAEVLELFKVKYVTQKKFEGCISDKGILMPFDFFIPSWNLAIEYDGMLHFGLGRFKGDSLERLAQTQRNDELKTTWCLKNSVDLLRIPFTKFKEIRKIIEYEVNKK